MMDFKEGEVLYFNKPLGWTSFKVVGHARYHICRRMKVKKLKVGHAGTLDPLATGVMVVCTGKATKRIEEFQYHTKEYIATIQLGATTPSYDLEHEIDATYPTEHITRELVEKTLKKFIGEIQQVPPAFSACMVNGKRAYDLARKGEEVELKPKLLVIDEIELLECNLPEIKVRVEMKCIPSVLDNPSVLLILFTNSSMFILFSPISRILLLIQSYSFSLRSKVCF